MNENHMKTTTFSSLILLILKELRLERKMHQAEVAEACDKTPSTWTKIELGQSPLTMEIFFRVCSVLNVQPSGILATAERYSILLRQYGWGVMLKQLSFNEDNLLKEAQTYYSSKGYKSRMPKDIFNTILNEPQYYQNGNINISAVFQFSLDENFKEEQMNPKFKGDIY